MDRKNKFALEMDDGYNVLDDLKEFQEHFDFVKSIEYFASGKLVQWMEDRNYYEIAKKLSRLNKDEVDFQRQFCEILDVELPKTAIDLIRYLVCKKTGSARIVNNPKFIQRVINGKEQFNGEPTLSTFVKQNSIEAIACEFNRYKKFWLVLRHDGPKAAEIINRARRLSRKLNRLAVTSVMDRIGDSSVSLEAVKKDIQAVSLFKKASTTNSLLRRAGNPSLSIYIVKTGKIMTKSTSRPFFMTPERKAIMNTIIASIVADLRPIVQGKSIRISEGMDYAFPTNEKQFMGPIPAFSSLSLPENPVIGIHWQNALNANGRQDRVDLDLHYTSGKIHVNRNTYFDSNDKDQVLHSGDLTDAPRPDGAAEIINIPDAVKDDFAALTVTKNTDNMEEIPFTLFFGKAEKNIPNRQRLINQQQFCTHITGLKIRRSKLLVGFVESHEGRKILHFIKTAAIEEAVVSPKDSNTANTLEAVRTLFHNRLSLNYILSLAGATLDSKENGEWDIDLSLNALTMNSFKFLSQKGI